jgi:hypothetical protein
MGLVGNLYSMLFGQIFCLFGGKQMIEIYMIGGAITFAIGFKIYYWWSDRKYKQKHPFNECDTCGQLTSKLTDGLCELCAKVYK